MEANERKREYPVVVEGPAAFLDVVYETIEAHVERTREEYAEIITGIHGEDAGDVEHEEQAALQLYVLGGVPPEEARELIDLALDRIADEHDMVLARQSVRLVVEHPEADLE